MIRPLTAIGFALALVGTAHAESAVKIETNGKSVRQVHAEIYQAAKQVCSEGDDLAAGDLPSGNECVELTYQNGLAQLHGHATVQPAAYAAQTGGAVLARP